MSRSGIPCKPYHAGLKQSTRNDTQAEWTNGQTPVIAATISFGMGIDKANVRSALSRALFCVSDSIDNC